MTGEVQFLCMINENNCFLKYIVIVFFRNKINPLFKLDVLSSICASYIILSSSDKGDAGHILNMPETDFKGKYSVNSVFSYE